MTTYKVVKWPESQQYMEHPEAIFIADEEKFGPSAYMVPTKLIKQTCDQCDQEAEWEYHFCDDCATEKGLKDKY